MTREVVGLSVNSVFLFPSFQFPSSFFPQPKLKIMESGDS